MSNQPSEPPTPPAAIAPAPNAAVTIDGTCLRRMFIDAGTLLQRHIVALNAINVFPVPDGDTGTNMHLTLRAGLEELEQTTGGDAERVMRAIAHGTLMGARGNSGVILSQVLDGFADALDALAVAAGADLARAFALAVDRAYAAISEPREGTILTVVRLAAEGAQHAGQETPDEVLAAALNAAKEAVERTPELLPVLKEAGVVDAGGLGLAILLEGLLRSLRGDRLDVNLGPNAAVQAGWRSEAATLHHAEHGESGYCTEFIVQAETVDRAAAGVKLGTLGTSLLLAGSDGLLRVHLHTTRPDDAIGYGRTLGDVSNVKVDNLEEQIRQFAAAVPVESMAAGVSVVAVAAGAGLEAAFRSMGVSEIVRGGQTMNPSAGEILQAIKSCPADQVIVLPNNKNIVGAARQAAKEAAKRVFVVPTRSIPQGIAAALALSADLSVEENVGAMERALASVRSAEITRAVRETTIGGKHVAVGQAIGIIDGELRVVTDNVASAARACVEEMLTPDVSLLTVYPGRDTRGADAEALVDELRNRYPAITVELVPGGQPHYPYILSLE